MKIPSIKIGDVIYIDSQLYLSHGVDDIIGGKTRVMSVEQCGNGSIWVRVELHPTTQYRWCFLSHEQKNLKKKFGEKWALKSPDVRVEFN